MNSYELNIDFIKTTDEQSDDYMDGDDVDLKNWPRRQTHSLDRDFYMKSMESGAEDDLHEK